MKRLLAHFLPFLAASLLGAFAWADAASPGGCFGDGGGNKYEKSDSGSDVKVAQGRAPARSDTRRTGAGLLSAAFVTSGWLFLRRQDPKR